MIAKSQSYILSSLVWLVCVVGILIGALFGLSLYLQKQYTNRIFPHVSINGQPVGHLNKTEVYILFSGIDTAIQTGKIELVFDNQTVATFSANTLAAHSNIEEAYQQAYSIGRSSHIPSRLWQTFLVFLGIQTYHFPLTLSYTSQPLQDQLAQFQDIHEKKPVNATFQFENNKATAFTREENGLHIEVQKTLHNADSSIKKWLMAPQKNSIRIMSTIVRPRVTLAQTNTLGIEELIGEGKSDYTHSIPQRIHNLLLGAAKLNGVIIPKGSTFSFNDAVGDISAATGYQPAWIIKDGKTVLGDGGGICQVSTTLFRTVMNTGLPITEHHSHAYRVGYYENDAKPGLDATVFGPTVDFKFVNDTPASILIQTSADEDNHLLFFKFYGKKDNRVSEVSTPFISQVSSAPEPRYQDDPTLKKGVVKQVDFAAPGARSQFSYKVTRNNQVIFQKDFDVWYRPWQAAFLVGTAD